MQIRLLTQNVRFLPRTFDPCAGRDRPTYRAKQIVEHILAEDYDIVCLQEVFDETSRGTLVEGLRDRYPRMVPLAQTGRPGPAIQDSGLFFATKLPLVSFARHPEWSYAFQPFSAPRLGDPSNPDALAEKGLCGCMLDCGGTMLWIFNTHLQSALSFADIRLKQFRDIVRTVHTVVRDETPATVQIPPAAILCGDMNVIGEKSSMLPTDEYRVMCDALSYPHDFYREHHSGDPGHTWDGTLNTMTRLCFPEDHDKQRLDYILGFDALPTGSDNARGPALTRVACTSIDLVHIRDDRSRDMSDHFGVGAVLDVPSIAA